MFFVAGAIAPLFGALRMWINTPILYNENIQSVMKYVLTLGVSLGVFVLYVAAALAISYLL